MADHAGKVAIITGAGTGIGRAAALALLQRDYRVVLAGRREGLLQETAALAKNPANALTVATDVADPASVARLFERALGAWDRVDVIFNNAGMAAPPILFEDITPEQWRAVVDVNLTGMFLIAQAAFRAMKAQTPQGGRIINNGSISAQVPRPNSAPYTATKHAVSGLTKSLALDGRKYNIACGQIDIGNAATSLTAAMSAGIIQANGTRLAEPTMAAENVGEAVAYMAGLPLDANVLSMTVMATAMPYVGRG